VHELVTVPQVFWSTVQSTGVLALSQWLLRPAAPQSCPFEQPKPGTRSQFTVPPHPSVMMPHWTPLAAFAAAQAAAGDWAAHRGSHTLNALLQTLALAHEGHWIKLAGSLRRPQPFQTGPHWAPRSLQVTGMHVTQVLVCGSHSEPFGQSPQLRKSPQLFWMTPQCDGPGIKSAHEVFGVTQVCPARSHTVPAAQPPHCLVWPEHGSVTGPHRPVQSIGRGTHELTSIAALASLPASMPASLFGPSSPVVASTPLLAS
jgi:hypothetical protein